MSEPKQASSGADLVLAHGFEALEMLTADLARFRDESSDLAWDQLLLHSVSQLAQMPLSFVCRVDPESADFVLSCIAPPEDRAQAEEMLDEVIRCGVFAWALRQNRLTEHRSDGHVWWFYPLASHRQVWGMWVGRGTLVESAAHEPLLHMLGLMVGLWLNAWENTRLRHEVIHDREVLELLVEERTRDLSAALDAAEAANRAKSLFLANISHELRTPLNGILGMAELMAGEKLDDMMRERVDSVRSCGETLLRVIEDVLEMTQIESGRLSYEMRSFTIYSLVEQIVERHRPSAEAKGLDLVLIWSQDIPMRVENDPDRLEQILDSLIHNAVKFTERGAVEVSVGVAFFEDEQVRLRFRVQDSGIGINGKDVAQLFKPFIQADPSTTRRYGGLGLGLAVSRTLARGMGGDITFEPASVRGSVFTLELPFDHPVTLPHAPCPAPIPGARRSVKIWIVDPMPPTRNAVALQLRRLGYEITPLPSLMAAPPWVEGTVIVLEASSLDAELPALRTLPPPDTAAPRLLVMLGAIPGKTTPDHVLTDGWIVRTLLRPVRSESWRETLENPNADEPSR